MSVETYFRCSAPSCNRVAKVPGTLGVDARPPAGWWWVDYKSRRLQRVEKVYGCCETHAFVAGQEFGVVVAVGRFT